MTTLADVRRRSARKLRDYKRLVMTADGTTTLLTDSRRLLDVNGAYTGTWLLIADSATSSKIGHYARIQSSTQATATATFTPPAPAAIEAGDVVELYNLFGRGYEPEVYDQVIAELVADSFPDWLDYQTADLAPVDYTDPDYAIPADFTHVYELQFEDQFTSGLWIPVPPGFYFVDPARQTITLKPQGYDALHGRSLRLSGFGRPTEPVADDDVITVPTAWLIPAVCATLAARRTGNREWQEWAVEWGREAEANKYHRQRPRPGNCIRVRD